MDQALLWHHPRRYEMKRQTITLKNGMKVVIDYDTKFKCEKCKREVLWALVPVELVSLALWDIHKCEEKCQNH